ncbi:hypothetical protein H4582DRAFT_2060170 [Lactarius indigo]|nr:hypothetical protein H4582DRAFT_2060170 [Lactarius indigo]
MYDAMISPDCTDQIISNLKQSMLQVRPCDSTSSRLGSGYHSEPEALSADENALATHEASSAVTPDEDGDKIVAEDLADTEDTNAFDILARDVNFSSLASSNPEPPDATLSSAPPPEGYVVTGTESSHPGAPVPSVNQGLSAYEVMRNVLGDTAWAPFRSQCDWEVVCWAKMCGPSSSAVTELLAIPEVVERLSLSYSTSNEPNSIIDKLPGPPPFKSDVLEVGGEHLQFHHRDIILCIQALFGKPEFTRDLVFAPEQHYADAERICRVYSEMHTGDWWWSVQTSL